ncbi:MAG: hypothetical protein ABFE13_12370 [Phycisphaerales bacterium]
MAFRIRFVKWETRPDLSYVEGPFFGVFAKSGADQVRCIHVLISPSDLRVLEDDTQGSHDKDRIKRAVIRYAIQRIEQGLRDGLFPPEPNEDTDNVPLEETDVLALRLLLREKTCNYQLQDGRDLLCCAASADDKTLCGRRDFRFIAPTSRATCYTCTLPDTDYLCAHFSHPEVHATSSNVREVSKGMCDIGRNEVQEPKQCHAKGHACWEWLIEPSQDRLPTAASPLELPEALDFLDIAWRFAFDKRQALLRLRDAVTTAKLSQTCVTRADFESQLSALADILKTMDIPDRLLSNTQKIDKDQTLTRLLDCLRAQLPSSDYDEVERAVSTIRTVNAVRVALQHSGAACELPTRLARLGISYPPRWGEAWDRIRAATIDALRVIREKLVKYAKESS